MVHQRLGRLPAHDAGPGAVVLEAGTVGSRLLGLARVDARSLPQGHALLLRPCSSIHTFGMRFPIDVVFADSDGNALRVVRDVPPWRILRCAGAAVALEARAGELSRFLEGGRGAGARLRPAIPQASPA
jgi:uncharacterized membrane protein (UPF0127 family)